jgi:hypothetical protein
MHSVSGGVISNAPGPIDLLQVCSISEANSNNNPTCSKIKIGIGNTVTNPNTYNSRSLKNYISSCPLSPALFTQALDDPTGISNGSPQVTNMQTIVQPALSSCPSVTFNYYSTGGHPAFVTNTTLQQDIRNFIGSIFSVSSSLTAGSDYYICNSNSENRFKLSTTPSSVGVNTITAYSVSSSFDFVRKDPVYKENILNLVKPIIQDTDNFNYLGNFTINSAFDNIAALNETSKFFITKKYKGNENTVSNNDINFEGSIKINDPENFNTGTAQLSDVRSPGVFIGDTRAFSSDNNPWTQVGTALSTLSSSVSIGELYFANNITISGISTESASSVAVTTYTHKLPVVINGETYSILLRT